MTEGETLQPQQEPADRGGRGVLAFGAVLLVVLVFLLVGGREEIGRAYGLSGEQGTLTIESCGRPHIALDDQRSVCTGPFEPHGGGDRYVVDALLSGHAGDTVSVGADGPDEPAYRSDLWGRLGAIALPLFPVALLWSVPGLWLAFRTPGALDRRRRTRLLLFSSLPTGLLLTLAVVALVVGIATT
jgi:hypothetical protein